MLPTPPVLPFYSEKEIDDIIEVVGKFPSETMLYLRPDYLHSAADGGYGPVEKTRRWALEDGIQYAAKVYIGDRHFDKPTTDLELRRQYKNAISLCEVLVKTLYEQRARLFGGLVPSNTEEPECRSVQQIIADLSQLQKWLAWRASHIRPSKKSGHGGSRRKSLASFDLWVRHLADIYHYVFELDPGFCGRGDTRHWWTVRPISGRLHSPDPGRRNTVAKSSPKPFQTTSGRWSFQVVEKLDPAILTLEDFVCIFLARRIPRQLTRGYQCLCKSRWRSVSSRVSALLLQRSTAVSPRPT